MGAGVGCDLPQRDGVGDSRVGVAVGEQDDGGPGGSGAAAGLLQAPQVAPGQVGHAPGFDRGDQPGEPIPAVVGDPPGGHHDLGGVVKGDQAERIAVVEAGDQVGQSPLGRLEPVPRHRPGAVQHDDGGVLGAGGGRVLDHGWGLQVEHDGDSVGGLDSDEVDIKVRGDVHAASILRGGSGEGDPGWVALCRSDVSESDSINSRVAGCRPSPSRRL